MSQIDCLKRKNFSSLDFFISTKARELGIDNITDDLATIANLMIVADKIQQVRDLLDKPVIVNSAYRCQALNKIVGGKNNSQHILGQAIDFICPKFGNPAAIFFFLKEKGLEVDQCLLESTWIHLSIKSAENRNQWGKYINGVFKKL